MRNIRCDEILNRNDFSKMTDADFEQQVQFYLIDKLNEYETAPSQSVSFNQEPIKKYEIFQLVFDSLKENNKIFMLNVDDIHYEEEIEEQELYYSRIIAKRICDNLKILHEDAIMGISVLEEEFSEKTEAIREKIKELRELDEEEYNLDLFMHLSVQGTPIADELEEIQNQNIILAEENKKLKEKLKGSESQIANLSNKLKISLDTIEKNRKKLGLNTQSKFEKLINKIKQILD